MADRDVRKSAHLSKNSVRWGWIYPFVGLSPTKPLYNPPYLLLLIQMGQGLGGILQHPYLYFCYQRSFQELFTPSLSADIKEQ
jgi:hypothetical protein